MKLSKNRTLLKMVMQMIFKYISETQNHTRACTQNKGSNTYLFTHVHISTVPKTFKNRNNPVSLVKAEHVKCVLIHRENIQPRESRDSGPYTTWQNLKVLYSCMHVKKVSLQSTNADLVCLCEEGGRESRC